MILATAAGPVRKNVLLLEARSWGIHGLPSSTGFLEAEPLCPLFIRPPRGALVCEPRGDKDVQETPLSCQEPTACRGTARSQSLPKAVESCGRNGNNDTARTKNEKKASRLPEGSRRRSRFTLRTSEFKGGDRVVWEQPRSLGWLAVDRPDTQVGRGPVGLWVAPCGFYPKCSSKDFWQRQGNFPREEWHALLKPGLSQEGAAGVRAPRPSSLEPG